MNYQNILEMLDYLFTSNRIKCIEYTALACVTNQNANDTISILSGQTNDIQFVYTCRLYFCNIQYEKKWDWNQRPDKVDEDWKIQVFIFYRWAAKQHLICYWDFQLLYCYLHYGMRCRHTVKLHYNGLNWMQSVSCVFCKRIHTGTLNTIAIVLLGAKYLSATDCSVIVLNHVRPLFWQIKSITYY